MNLAKSYVKNLKELRFIINPKCDKSLGVRTWINNNFNTHSKNINTQFIIRECEDIDSVLLARFGNNLFILEKGIEKKYIVTSCSENEIQELVSKVKNCEI